MAGSSAGDEGVRAAGHIGFKPGTGRRLQSLAAALFAILLVGFLVVHTTRSHRDHRLAAQAANLSSAPPPVEVVTVRSAPGGRPLVLPGETNAWYESTIYARVNGYVGSWSANIGDHVTRGQLLATIETPELDAGLVAARAKLLSSEAEVKVREAKADFAATTYARWRDSPKGVVSEQERADKKAQYESAQAELAAARAQVNVDQAEVDRLRSFEQFKQVTAPYSGTITERHIDIGNLVSAGSSSQTTPLYRMAKVDPVRVFVDVPQSAATDLMKVGAPAEVTAGDLAGRRFVGKVTRTSEAIDPRARTLRTEIDLPNPDLVLLPGMYVQVTFELANNGTVQVPASALVFRADGPHVAVKDAADAVHFVPVSIARDDGSMVELGGGVTQGDKVVLNISNQILDGQQVHATTEDGHPLGLAAREPK